MKDFSKQNQKSNARPHQQNGPSGKKKRTLRLKDKGEGLGGSRK